MTALEIRIIGYALAALAIFGSCAWVGAHFTAKHYEAVIAANTAAQQAALVQAQQRVIAAQNAQEAAEMAAESEHEARTKADTASRSAVLDSMRDLQTAVSRRLLPAAVANSGAVQTAQPSAGGDQRLAQLLGRVDASLDRLIDACQGVDNDRTSIISIAPKVTQ